MQKSVKMRLETPRAPKADHEARPMPLASPYSQFRNWIPLRNSMMTTINIVTAHQDVRLSYKFGNRKELEIH